MTSDLRIAQSSPNTQWAISTSWNASCRQRAFVSHRCLHQSPSRLPQWSCFRWVFGSSNLSPNCWSIRLNFSHAYKLYLEYWTTFTLYDFKIREHFENRGFFIVHDIIVWISREKSAPWSYELRTKSIWALKGQNVTKNTFNLHSLRSFKNAINYTLCFIWSFVNRKLRMGPNVSWPPELFSRRIPTVASLNESSFLAIPSKSTSDTPSFATCSSIGVFIYYVKLKTKSSCINKVI